MHLNLDKSITEKQYYYEDKGNTLGPFPISRLLSKINENTLVYREGIDWTIAKEIPELKNYFHPSENVKNENKIKSDNVIIKKKKNLLIWALILVVIVVAGLFWTNKNKIFSKQANSEIDSINLKENLLSDFEIFDLESIKKFTPNQDQKNQAIILQNNANSDVSNNNFTEAIIKYKESLKNYPNPQTYFLLSDVYLKNNDFQRSEQCIQIASNLDYQPKSELDYKLLSIHVMQGDFNSVKNELINLSISNHSILKKVSEDTLFYNFRFSPAYLKIIEKNSVFDTIVGESVYPSIIISYFEAFNNQNFDAINYFSDYVSQYINKKNTNPDEINNIIANNTEFTNSKINLIGTDVIISGINSRDVWTTFTCFRKSKNKYQTSRVKLQFIFDDQNKITSYKEIEVKDTKFNY
jgi:tetratricopeptide (TPR) repeat protein